MREEQKRVELGKVMEEKARRFAEMIGEIDSEEELDTRGAVVIAEWEKLVKEGATKVLGRKMIVCKQAVKWWDQELRVAIDERREVHRK